MIARIERLKAETIRIADKRLKEALRLLLVPPVRPPLPPALQVQQLRAAMNDPVLQTQFQQVVMLYIMTNVLYQTSSSVNQLLEQLGPEATPAVVEGINFVALNQLGFC